MKTFAKMAGLVIGCGVVMASVPAKADVYFRDNDRTVIRSYVTTTPATTSTSTSTVTTYYAPGTALPDTITYSELPTTVTTRLVTPPPGDKYVVVGRTAYLIEPQKRVVIDAERLDDEDTHEGVRATEDSGD